MKLVTGLGLLLTLGVYPGSLQAQVDRYVDKVILKNGNVLWGLTEISGDELEVYLSKDEALTLPMSQVHRIKTQRLNPALYEKRQAGTYHEVRLGTLLGKEHSDLETQATLSASVINGHRFHRHLGIGLGAGLFYYPVTRHVPLFANVQGDLLTGTVTPLYFLNTGWSWASKRNTFQSIDEVKGGYYLEPGAGVKWHWADVSLQLLVSYTRQGSRTNYAPIDLGNGNVITNSEKRTLQRVNLGLGVTF